VKGVDVGAVEEIIVSRVKQIRDGRQVVAALAEQSSSTPSLLPIYLKINFRKVEWDVRLRKDPYMSRAVTPTTT